MRTYVQAYFSPSLHSVCIGTKNCSENHPQILTSGHPLVLTGPNNNRYGAERSTCVIKCGQRKKIPIFQ